MTMIGVNDLPDQISDEELDRRLRLGVGLADRERVELFEGLVRRVRVWIGKYRTGRWDDELFSTALTVAWTELNTCLDSGVSGAGHLLARMRLAVGHRVLNDLRDLRSRHRLVTDIGADTDGVDNGMGLARAICLMQEGIEDALHRLNRYAGPETGVIDRWIMEQLIDGERRRDIVARLRTGASPIGRAVSVVWANKVYNESMDRLTRLIVGAEGV